MEGITREEILSFIDSLPMFELSPVTGDSLFCSVAIDPRDKSIVFSDRMKDILGPAAVTEMFLSQYYNYIPESERKTFISKYNSSISELVTGALETAVINHPLTDQNGEKVEVSVMLRLYPIEQRSVVIGYVINKTPSLSQRGYAQLFGEGVECYFFTYDMKRDRCFVSRRFVEDFDLRSGVIDNFGQTYSHFVAPDSEGKLTQFINWFGEHGSLPEDSVLHLMSPGRGEIYLKLEGLSNAGIDGRLGGDDRYLSGVMSDITDFVLDRKLQKFIIESSSAVTFTADLKRETVTFSENLQTLFPDSNLRIEGDFVETIADLIVKEDRKRFRNSIHRAMNEMNTPFSFEVRVVSSLGKIHWIACRGRSIEDRVRNNRTIVGSLFDLTQMNEVKENVEKRSASNEITGLPTRDRLIGDATGLIRDRETLSCGIMLVDIHDFHAFNDRYGRTAGNEILIALADLLKEKIPDTTTLYHIGIDTFAVLWPEASQKKIEEFMADFQEIMVTPLETPKGSFFVNLGISAAFYPLGSTAEEIITNAEIALHKVKQNKKLKYAIYTPVDMHELKERVDFELQITQAIRNHMESFQLYYQPLIDAHTGNLVGAEALLRWQAPSGELVNPEKVVDALESTDQMAEVGIWILNEAMSQCAEWISKGAPENFFVHVNATADDLVRQDYASEVMNTLGSYRLTPDNVLIEITETSLMKNMSLCRKNLFELHELGIKTALDDFGSGYSSFNYLKELPVDEIKIDKTFVDDMEEVDFDRSFISAMTMLAHSIGKKVVVEGVETQSQADMLRDMGTDIFQGYHFGKPMSVFAFWNQYFS